MFAIKSTSSDRELIFSNRSGDYFNAELKGTVIAAVKVCAYTDTNGLNELFQKLALFDEPWKNELFWESIESDFKITASCSSIGGVQLNVVLCALQGAPEEYRIEAGLECELGQLKKIAKESQEFFK